MRSDLVEKVARALSLNQRNRARVALGHEPVADCGDSWTKWVDEARTAIEATGVERLREALGSIANMPDVRVCREEAGFEMRDIARTALTNTGSGK